VRTAVRIAALALALALMAPLRGYLTDDTFIHLQYARHLAAGAGPVFNPGERVYGCTSPLWMVLLALGIKLGLDGLLVAKALGGLGTLASVLLFERLARASLRAPALAAAATLVWAGHAWMLRWSLSGMETPLAVALTLAGFVAFAEGAEREGGDARAGVWWALAALTRPEAAVLLLLWAAVALEAAGRRPAPSPLARAFLPPAAIYGAWLLFARAYYGAWWPQTLSAKAAGSAGLEGRLDSLRRQIEVVGVTDGVLAAVLILALVAGGARVRRAHFSARALLPWGWVLAVPALYVARGVPVLSRYLVPLLPVMAWLAWRAAEARWVSPAPPASAARRARALGVTVGTLALAQNLAVYAFAVVPQVVSFTRGMEHSLIPFGRWIDAHAAPRAVVATPDIGAIGYFGRRRVLDLGGLVTPRMISLLERAPFEDIVARFEFADWARPDFVLDRGPQARDLVRRSRFGPALAALDSAAVPNLGIAHPGRVVYTLYRVDWSRFEELRRAP